MTTPTASAPAGTVTPNLQAAPLFAPTTLFSQQAVKQLSAEDFNLSGRVMIDSKITECMLVLFYIQNEESTNVAQIWANAAVQSVGPQFAAINLSYEKRVAEALVRIRSSGSHPYQRIGLRGAPFILAYRDGWPVGAYNGPRTTAAIVDYAQTLACRPDYQELSIVAESIQPTQNLETSGVRVGQTPYTVSTQFGSTPIRGYVNQPVVVVGSAAEAAEARNLAPTVATAPITPVPVGATPAITIPAGATVATVAR